MHIVLFEPEIPQNTGNIVRTCAITGSVLHLVKPLGFSIEDKYLKRAGLDYWQYLDIHVHESFQEIQEKHPNNRYFYVTTRGNKLYTEINYSREDFLVFGKETAGLPEAIIGENMDRCLRIPMIEEARSINLSNSVAIVLFEALRQQGFSGLA